VVISPHCSKAARQIARPASVDGIPGLVGRDNYIAFNHELAVRGLVNQPLLLDLLHKTAIDAKTRLRIQARIAVDFRSPQRN
jgi:hypothetical protein